jgi:hypothetical protein
MYLSPGTWVRFPRKAKTPIVKGVGEDREVAVPGSPKARAVTICMLVGDERSNNDGVQSTCHKVPSTTKAKSSRSTNGSHILGKCQLSRNVMQGLVYKFMLASLQWSIQAR